MTVSPPIAATPAASHGVEPSKIGDVVLAAGALLGIAIHLVLQYGFASRDSISRAPLWATLALGGTPLVYRILRKLLRRDLGSDLLAGISIVASVILGQYLAGSLVVLMMAGGAAIEGFAVRRAASVLQALAKRLPSIAHRRRNGSTEDVQIENVDVGDLLVIFPHDICPVDGVVQEGHGTMDESYLTGEPFVISKSPGSDVLSGAINGESVLTIRAARRAVDSRYAKITQVMRESEQKRPHLRRLGDQLGAIYVPVTLAVAGAAWAVTGDPMRFLSVLVIATPCPLLIAIPVAVIGAISLAAKRTIIIKDPAILERVDTIRTMIFDKTGTLTYGAPQLTGELLEPGVDADRLLQRVASLERYSKHPLAGAIMEAAKNRKLQLQEAEEVSERPGEGLRGKIDGSVVLVTGRKAATAIDPKSASVRPAVESGLECFILLDGRCVGLYRFHDAPRTESRSFVGHLGPRHLFDRILLVSGDRASEVAYLAAEVGITEIHAGKTPEEKLVIVTEETKRAPTLYLGDGINDAPALMAATVGVAFGQKSDVTSEAAGAVILETTLKRVDELIHIGRRMRSIALQSAIGGMILSLAGMVLAAWGLLPPVAGAIAQEAIDLLAILNALRVAIPPRELSDF
jgi:heavy metal translocating P-type ATPase